MTDRSGASAGRPGLARRRVLAVLAVALGMAALATLVPHAASPTNDFGYRSLCPFAPTSTLMLAFAGAFCWMLRAG